MNLKKSLRLISFLTPNPVISLLSTCLPQPIWSYLKRPTIKNKIKIIPYNIVEYLTPLALTIWIMDDGTKVSKGLKLNTNTFTYSECVLLVKVLYENFNLKSSVQSAGAKDQYVIYIWKESLPLLRNIVSPYIVPEMKYKIIE